MPLRKIDGAPVLVPERIERESTDEREVIVLERRALGVAEVASVGRISRGHRLATGRIVSFPRASRP